MHVIAAAALRFGRGLRQAGGRVPAWALPAAIAALALALRLHGLGDKPFWLDEVTSLRRATSAIPDLVADSLHNTHYPSYFLLLWLVVKIGASQWLLRLPSALCGAFAAALACAIGRQAGGARAGAVAGLLMALSPFEVQFGQEARSYALVSCLILTALWGLVRLAQTPAAAALPLTRNEAPRVPWAAYGLGTAAALAVLNVAIPWLVAANLGALAIGRGAGGARPGFVRNWIGVQLLILAAWLPLLAAVCVASKGAVLDGAGWSPPEGAAALREIAAAVYLLRISRFITFDLAPAAVPGLGAAVAAMAALGAWRLRREPTMLWVLGAAALTLPLGLGLVSLFVPVLVPRYFAWGAGPFFIFAGAGAAQLSGARFAALAASLGAVGLANLAPYYATETKPRWDLVATRLAADAQPGDVVLVDNGYAYSVLSMFAARAGLDGRSVKLTWRPSEAAQIAAGHDVWAVYGRAGQGKKQSAEDYRQSLAALGRPVLEKSIGRYIVLWRFRSFTGPDPAATMAATPAGNTGEPGRSSP